MTMDDVDPEPLPVLHLCYMCVLSMGPWLWLGLGLAMLGVPGTGAKLFGRCELAHMLQDGSLDGYEGYSLGNWVCLAFHASGLDTEAMNPSTDGSRNYGLFQINSGWWCHDGLSPSEDLCHLHCQDLLTSDIKHDIICAKRVVQDPMGMESWEEWKTHCEGKEVGEWIKGCGL